MRERGGEMSFENIQWTWMNGDFVPWAESTVPLSTHALHYGTGVFEGIRSYSVEGEPAVFRSGCASGTVLRIGRRVWHADSIYPGAVDRGDLRADSTQRFDGIVHPTDCVYGSGNAGHSGALLDGHGDPGMAAYGACERTEPEAGGAADGFSLPKV